MKRRELLSSANGLLAAIAALVSWPALQHAWRSSRVRDAAAQRWADLGSPSKFEDESWQRRSLGIEVVNRWRRETREEVVFARRTGDGGFEALSAICPHTGCLVRAEAAGFACPCHRSRFDASGRSLEGPAPRPLDRLECKVERGRVLVRHQRFRPGLKEPVVIDG